MRELNETKSGSTRNRTGAGNELTMFIKVEKTTTTAAREREREVGETRRRN